VITNTLLDPAEQHMYSLSGVAGDVIRITTVSKTGNVSPDIDLFFGGVRVGGWYYNDGFTTLALTNTGTYIALVRDRYNGAAGTYTLGVSYATPKCTSVVLSCERPLSAVLIDPAQQHMYSLPGLAGEIIHITSTPVSGGFSPDVDVFNPAGTRVGGFGYNDFQSRLLLTNTGTFTVAVRDRFNGATGSYLIDLAVVGGCAQITVGSVNSRTQEIACLPIRMFAAAPATFVSFTLAVPCGHLTNVSFATGGRFVTSTFSEDSSCQWSVATQTAPDNPLLGDELIGSLCFTPVSTESAFVPITIANLSVTNADGNVPGASASGNRIAVIADKPLLEALLGSHHERLLALYGKTNQNYEIREATNPVTASPWPLAWVTNVPTSLSTTSTIRGTFSNAPSLFIRANEP
jgi:hypothetical protein